VTRLPRISAGEKQRWVHTPVLHHTASQLSASPHQNLPPPSPEFQAALRINLGLALVPSPVQHLFLPHTLTTLLYSQLASDHPSTTHPPSTIHHPPSSDHPSHPLPRRPKVRPVPGTCLARALFPLTDPPRSSVAFQYTLIHSPRRLNHILSNPPRETATGLLDSYTPRLLPLRFNSARECYSGLVGSTV
jgi:hypothetical protein